MSEQLDCEFCEQPLSEHTVAGACPVEVMRLSPVEMIAVGVLRFVSRFADRSVRAIFEHAILRTANRIRAEMDWDKE